MDTPRTGILTRLRKMSWLRRILLTGAIAAAELPRGTSAEPNQPTMDTIHAVAPTTEQLLAYKQQNEHDRFIRTPYAQEGTATVYDGFFHDRTTASGARFRHDQNSAAVPIGSPLFNRRRPIALRITNLDNGKSIVVSANDLGNFGYGKNKEGRWQARKYAAHSGTARVVDLSYHAALDLGMISADDYVRAAERGFKGVSLPASGAVKVEALVEGEDRAVLWRSMEGYPGRTIAD